MKHLTFDEILDFVSMNTISSDTLDLASRVNTHIRQCGECLEKVKAYQAVYDVVKSRGKTRDFFTLIDRETEKNRDMQDYIEKN